MDKYARRAQRVANTPVRECKQCSHSYRANRPSFCSDSCSRAFRRNYMIKWRRDNDRSEYQKAWHLAHPDYFRKYDENHREIVREQKALGQRRRRARIQKVDHRVIAPGDLARLIMRSGNRCSYCGISFKETKVTWDHVVPISRGGRDGIGNLLPCCGKCNSSKNSQLLTEWYRGPLTSLWQIARVSSI